MSTRNRLALAFALLALVSTARATGLSNSVTPQLGGGIGGSFDAGISKPPAAVANACTGAIDLTTSCVQPMLGGL